jgi:hypothetical protein
MPHPSKGTRLYKRKERYRDGKLVAQTVSVFKGGSWRIATGCSASAPEAKPLAGAKQALPSK